MTADLERVDVVVGQVPLPGMPDPCGCLTHPSDRCGELGCDCPAEDFAAYDPSQFNYDDDEACCDPDCCDHQPDDDEVLDDDLGTVAYRPMVTLRAKARYL